jgi:hypothetical protein
VKSVRIASRTLQYEILVEGAGAKHAPRMIYEGITLIITSPRLILQTEMT